MTECTCYLEYPNECHKHKNGKWKCVDNYECIRPLEEIKLPGLPFPRVIRKTKCVKVRQTIVKNLRDLYEKNYDFKEYVDKYCAKNQIHVEEALEHYIVKDVAKYYLDINNFL